MRNRYPLRFSVDYADRDLDRVSTGFRIFTVIPIAIVLATLSGATAQLGTGAGSTTVVLGGAGLLFIQAAAGRRRAAVGAGRCRRPAPAPPSPAA